MSLVFFHEGEVFHGGGDICDTLGGGRYAVEVPATRQTNEQTNRWTASLRKAPTLWLKYPLRCHNVRLNDRTTSRQTYCFLATFAIPSRHTVSRMTAGRCV